MLRALLLLCLLTIQTAALEAHTEIKVRPGQEATFRCPCPSAATITLLEWSRHGLDPIFYRSSFQIYQPESFGDRVELKDGSLTLILKNVTIGDSATYKCRIVFRNKNSAERPFSGITCFINLTVSPSDHTDVKVRSGQDVTLQCRGPGDADITTLEWSRPEIKSEGYVFFFQDQRSYENYQHESFKGRVELRDSSMTDGDVSVILRNVSISDTGIYECKITTNHTITGERVTKEFRHAINLTVTDTGFKEEDENSGGDEGGGVSLIIGLALCGVLVVAAASAVVITKAIIAPPS